MTTLVIKKNIILQRELVFANAIGAAVFEKPKVSFWMVLIPILFLYFVYRMQKFKNGRMQFDEEFMTTRRRAMDIALNAAETDGIPDIDEMVQDARLPEPLRKPFSFWVKALGGYYMELLAADGDSFAALARSAYGNRDTFLLILNSLSTVERDFYTAIRPHLSGTHGASDVIDAIESQSRRLRCELAEEGFC